MAVPDWKDFSGKGYLGQLQTYVSNNAKNYGIVFANDIAGHRTVPSKIYLASIPDPLLSASKNNTDNDALNQLWYVPGEGYYWLKDWNKRHAEDLSGWEKIKIPTVSEYEALINNMTWKPAVNRFEDIATTYPNPEEGWTVSVKDTNFIYRYDAETDTWINIFQFSGALAQPSAANGTGGSNGLMSAVDKYRLDTWWTNYITYIQSHQTLTVDSKKYIHPTSHPLSILSDLNANYCSLLSNAPTAFVTRWPKYSEVTEKFTNKLKFTNTLYSETIVGTYDNLTKESKNVTIVCREGIKISKDSASASQGYDIFNIEHINKIDSGASTSSGVFGKVKHDIHGHITGFTAATEKLIINGTKFDPSGTKSKTLGVDAGLKFTTVAKSAIQKIGHSNSITAQTTQALGKFSYDAHGHITGFTPITDIDASGITLKSLVIQLNGGSTEGTNKFTYDGKTAKSLNINPTTIGVEGNYLKLSGGSMNKNAQIIYNNGDITLVKGRDKAFLRQTKFNNYSPLFSIKTESGSWEAGSFINDALTFTHINDTKYNANDNTEYKQIIFFKSGEIQSVGFRKIGINNNYVLTGGGGHKEISDFVQKTRKLVNGIGITGCGDFSADRTISLTEAPANGTSIGGVKRITAENKGSFDNDTAVPTLKAVRDWVLSLGYVTGSGGTVASANKLTNPVTITIGNTGKSFDGSAGVSWTLNEIGAASTNHTHNYAGSTTSGGAANSVKNNLIIKLNKGTTENSNLFTFNGSTSKTVNITPASIGAALASHTHNYAAASHNHSAANITSGILNKAQMPANVAYLDVAQTWTKYQDFTAGAGNTGSDMRFKQNVKGIKPVLDNLLKLDIISYIWKKEGEAERDTFGVNAKQLKNLQGIFEKIVHVRDDKDKTQWVEYDRFGVLAIKGIQELERKRRNDKQQLLKKVQQQDLIIEKLEKENQTFRRKQKDLENRIKKIELMLR